MRLNTLPTLHSDVASLPVSALKDALNLSLSQADAAIDAIRSAGSAISIDVLYDQLKIIESALDAHFIDLVDDSVDLALISRARILVIAKPIEQRYDYLKYITGKIKSYARDEVKAEFAALLRLSVLDLADGDGAAYRTRLVTILARVEECRGPMIKQEEADRIRDKADSLLRKIAENGVNRACDVDLSMTIADIDIDGGLTWNEADYRAPSKDVRTHGLAVAIGYAGDDCGVSIDYQYEWRDYSDRLKDDSDRIEHSLDVSVSRDFDSRSADLSASFDDEFYPNDIDEEIELGRVVQARAAIIDFLDHVLGLHLSATLENRLVKDLGEEGALGALATWDRSEAVDCVEDFVDDLLDAEWDHDIEPDTSQALIVTACGILPRRTIQNIDIPLSLGFPFRDGDAMLDLEWENKIYPADGELDHDTSTGKLSYTKDESALTLSGYLEREELVYPNVTTKHRLLHEWEGAVDKEMACGDLALTLFHQQTTYPLASKKDQSVQKIDLDLDIDIEDLSIAFQWTDKATTDPNDASKPIVQLTKMSLDADWDVGEGTLSASLSDQEEWNAGHTDASKPIVQVTEMGLDADWDVGEGTLNVSLRDKQERNADHADASLAEKILVKETRQAELSWDGKITDDLDLALSLTYNGCSLLAN